MKKSKYQLDNPDPELRKLIDEIWDRINLSRDLEYWMEQEEITEEELKYPLAKQAHALKNSKLYKALK